MSYRHIQTKKRMTPPEFVQARRVAMSRATAHFRSGVAFPERVYLALERHGVDPSTAVLVEDNTPPQTCCDGEFAGIILTDTGRFLEFTVTIDADSADGSVRDLTAETPIHRYLGGTGPSDAFLARELLDRLRAPAGSSERKQPRHPLGTEAFSVALSPPSSGSITIQLCARDQSLRESFSHCYPSLEHLCAAMLDAGSQRTVRPVVLLLEPQELELRVDALAGGASEFSARVFHDRTRDRRPPPKLAITLPTRTLVLVVWRALRRLGASLPAAEFEREWRTSFPSDALARLSELVESWPASEDAG